MATAPPALKASELAPSIPPKDPPPTTTTPTPTPTPPPTTTTTTTTQQQFAPRTTSKGAAMPGVSVTAKAIQRIAEQGAPPLKLSTSTSTTTTSSKPASSGTTSARTPASAIPARKPLTADSSTPRSQLHQRPSTSTGAGDTTPSLPPRPNPNRASSHEKNGSADRKEFLKKLKKGREQIQADGLKAANFLNKVSHHTWGKLKNQRLVPPGKGGHGGHRSGSPSHSISGERDTSADVDVFGLTLKEAVEKTRVVVDRKRGGDATYWMPAIAYRCLQYLNVYGPHELGIYRISGSTSVVDELRAAFKIHHDVDLFESPPDDLHTVSSLLKGWFRSLPEAVLPLDVQKRIYEKCKDNTDDTRPPQAFIDELSNLPPYNYYLLHHLFSHLSTICLESDVNKMNLANLGMIFCSTLRIDRFCFNWLVNSWADCWAGCNTEEEEYEHTHTLKLQRQGSSSTVSRESVEPNGVAAARTPTASPLARSSSRAHSDHHPERERERDRERENGSPLALIDSKTRENGDDRTMSMVVETNATPRISHRNSVDGVVTVKEKPTVLLVQPENQI